LRFSGIITKKDTQAMSQAIEEGCEQVNSGNYLLDTNIVIALFLKYICSLG